MFVCAVVAAMASAWLVNAQDSPDSDTYHSHAAFAFIRTGERTPILRNDTQKLTALGANQMYDLGQTFRSRYVAGKESGDLGVERIARLSPDVLDNDQILVRTLDKPYLMSAAQAFMQGLYPPHEVSNNTEDATGALADGTVIDYPLNGYQYASIQAASQDDPKSIYIDGAQSCPMAQRDAMEYFQTDAFTQTKGASEELYSSLNVDWFEGTLKEDQLTYLQALEIFDYLDYQNTHNSSIHDDLTNSTYNQLSHLADEVAWNLYGRTSLDSTSANNQATGGKTLALSILDTFSLVIADKNTTNDQAELSHPLTFYFGEQGTMMSLLSLITADSENKNFQSIPSYGSAMVFELFSTGENADFPSDPDDLWVRFSFHNATSNDAKAFTSSPIFGNGPTHTDMPWNEFASQMDKIAMDVSAWCTSCNSASPFCRGSEAVGRRPGPSTLPSASSTQSLKLSPAVAGAIGAVVTLVVATLLFAITMFLAGIRFHRVQRSPQAELGGFKGSAKLASDPDLSRGAPAATAGIVSFGDGAKKGHERVGSWELRQKEFGKESGDRDSRGSSMDGIDAVAVRPVEPNQRI